MSPRLGMCGADLRRGLRKPTREHNPLRLSPGGTIKPEKAHALLDQAMRMRNVALPLELGRGDGEVREPACLPSVQHTDRRRAKSTAPWRALAIQGGQRSRCALGKRTKTRAVAPRNAILCARVLTRRRPAGRNPRAPAVRHVHPCPRLGAVSVSGRAEAMGGAPLAPARQAACRLASHHRTGTQHARVLDAAEA